MDTAQIRPNYRTDDNPFFVAYIEAVRLLRESNARERSLQNAVVKALGEANRYTPLDLILGYASGRSTFRQLKALLTGRA